MRYWEDIYGDRFSVRNSDLEVLFRLINGQNFFVNQRYQNKFMQFANKEDNKNMFKFIPDITDVEVIDNDSVKVVIVKFADGTFEKAVQNPEDTYSLEQGISICITKKLISKYTKNETAEYNKIIRNAIKVMKNNKKIAEKKAADEQAEKARIAKLIEKKKARKAKREAAEREREIEIQLEAYRRALNSHNISAVADNGGSVVINQSCIAKDKE